MLAPDENVQAAFEVDLTPELRFAPGLLVLSDRRLLARAMDGATQQWPLAPGMVLRMLDHGGVGTLELHDDQQRLALWRFTLGRHPQALHLQQRLEQQIAHLQNPQALAVQRDEAPCCAVCGTPLPAGSDECPACARQQAKPTSTWVLLRL